MAESLRPPVQCSDGGDSEMQSEGGQRNQTGRFVSPPPAPPANVSPPQTGSSSGSDIQTDAAQDNQAAPTPEQLDIVSDGLSTEWRRLGRTLKVAESTLDQIELDFKSYGQREINYQFLRRWTQKQPRTLHTLAQALVDIGRGDLADQLTSS